MFFQVRNQTQSSSRARLESPKISSLIFIISSPLTLLLHRARIGTTGGIAQVMVGQPFDLLKVRIQTAPQGTYTG